MAKTLEVNLATLEKQQEIIDKLNESGGGEINYLYTLASFDTTARDTDLESLKGLEHIKQVANSSTAMQAVANSSTAMQAVLDSSTAMQAVLDSSTAMQAVANSSTAMQALLNSDKTRRLVYRSASDLHSGKFLPLKASNDLSSLQAYNGFWSNVGTELGGWLRENINNPIATQIKHSNTTPDRWVYVYDLNA